VEGKAGARRGSDPAERRARIRRLTLQLDAMLRAQDENADAHEAPTARTTPPRTPLGIETSEGKKAAEVDASEAKPQVHAAEEKPVVVNDAANSPTAWPSSMDATAASTATTDCCTKDTKDWPSSVDASPVSKDAAMTSKDWPSSSPKSTDGWPSAKGSTAGGEEGLRDAPSAETVALPSPAAVDAKQIAPEFASSRCSEQQLEEGLGHSEKAEKSIPLSVHRRRMIMPLVVSGLVCCAFYVPELL
jgi:hypothetical protein